MSLTRADGTVTASWPAVSGATKYHATYSTDGGGSWHAPVDGHTNITTTSITFNADNAKPYIVGLRAGNDNGQWSGWRNSPEAGPYTPPDANPPAAVGSITLNRSVATLTVSWNAVSGADKYHAVYQADGGDWLPPVPGHENITTTSFSFNIDNGKSYVVGVRAGNANGWGPWTDSPASHPPLPAAVGSITLTRSDTTLTVSWNAVDGAANYHALYQADGAGDWLPPITDYQNITATGFTFDVDNNKSYVVGVRAGNSAGWGPWTDSPASGPYTPPTPTPNPTPEPEPPATPAGLTAAPGDGSVTLAWDDPGDSTITGYEYNVNHNDTSTGNLSGWSDWTALAGSGAATTSHTFTGLTNGKEYRYHLRAVNGGGHGAAAPNAAPWYVVAVPAVPLPAAPANLSVTPGDGYLDITWDAVSGATGYDVRAKTADSSDWHDVASNITTTSHRYTTDATIDYVAVRARNANGPGNWTELSRLPAHDWLNVVQSSGGASSQSGSIAAKLAAPATITVTRDNARDEKLHVSWAAVTGASGYNLACSQTDGWSWWQCGSTTSASTTSLTVDNGPRGGLHSTRKYMVAVRAVTSNEADASDWKRSENVYPAFAQLRNLTHRRSGGSMTLYWTPNFYTTGYEIDCAVSGSAYTRCATLTNQKDTDTQHSVTISTWTVGGTTYNIDDGVTYDVKITSTNQWGKSATGMRPPLIGPIPNVSNLGETSDTYGQEVKSTRSVATGFSTGSNSGGYTLQGVTIGFLGLQSNRIPDSPLSVAIHAVSGGNPAATATHTLTKVHGSTTTAGNATYACSGTCRLSANTSYFLVLSTASASHGYKWDTTAGDNEVNTSNFGWTIDNKLRRQTDNGWSDSNWTTRFRVSATLGTRSLTSSNIAETTATLTIANHAGNWYYKHTNTGATCDGPVSGTSVNVTGLTANTSYTYSAYSDSSCSTLLATAAAFTTAASVGNLGEATDGQGQDVTQLARAATGFSTGTNSGGYLLQSVTLAFRTPSSGTPERALNVAIHAESSENSDIPATAATYTLNKVSGDPKLAGNVTYDCSGTCPLAANTKYFLEPSTEGVIPYKWDSTFSDDETNTGNLGWTIDDGLKYDDPTTNTWITRTWSGKFQMSALLVE